MTPSTAGRRYTAMHWGIYEVEARAGQLPLIHALPTDPDPSPIGLEQHPIEPDRFGRIKLLHLLVSRALLPSRLARKVL